MVILAAGHFALLWAGKWLILADQVKIAHFDLGRSKWSLLRQAQQIGLL